MLTWFLQQKNVIDLMQQNAKLTNGLIVQMPNWSNAKLT
jgi:hypothetical protein